jgi:uncharacterized protein YuzE
MTTKEKARQALVELAEQAQLREIPFDYDDVEDVMYFTLGTSDEAVTVPLAEGLYVDIDAETEQVVGIELIRFKERFCQQYPELRQAWETVQRAERKVLESFSSMAQVGLAA